MENSSVRNIEKCCFLCSMMLLSFVPGVMTVRININIYFFENILFLYGIQNNGDFIYVYIDILKID